MKNKILKYIIISFTCLTIALNSFGLYSYKNKDQFVVYADSNVQINPFVWLCSYLGINIYTDAQEINDAFYDAISIAWATYQESLQDNGQRVSIDDIIGSISWDSQQPKMIKISGWAFNALRAFADYLDSKVTTASEALEIGTFETENPASYYTSTANVNFYVCTFSAYGETRSRLYKTNADVRYVVFDNGNNYLRYTIIEVSQSPFNYGSMDNKNFNSNVPIVNSASSYVYNNVTYYLNENKFYRTSDISNFQYTIDNVYPYISNDTNRKNQAIEYTFGASSSGGDATLNDIYALPDQSLLYDLIGASDPDQDVTIDIEDSDLPWSTAVTLQDILDAINSLTDTYVLDNSWPETIGKVIAQSQSITNEITDVDYPNALTWEVPDVIGLPVITPLIAPECPTMSACIVSAIEDIGNTMTSIISTNSNIGNYTSAILFMGLALWIIGRGM